jgi:formyltetrahydrofolate deformylase
MSEHERTSPAEPSAEPSAGPSAQASAQGSAEATRAPTARLLLSAPDRPGLVASIAEFIYRNGGDVTEADQHTDEEEGMFFQRVEFRLGGFKLSREELSQALAEVATPLKMKWSVRYSDEDRRVAVLVSRQPHCLVDLLGRWYAHELPGRPVLVASNHRDHAELVSRFGIDFQHLPVTKQTRDDQEELLLEALADANVELVVLARYMQVLSGRVIDDYPSRGASPIAKPTPEG